jgi:hypothetical protein
MAIKWSSSPMRGAPRYAFNNLPKGVGLVVAEVGVWEGQNACTWLVPNPENGSLQLKELILVDPLKGSAQLNIINAITTDYPVAKFLNIKSTEAAAKFADEYFDFIYIDAIHFYADVAQDLAAWGNKVKKGCFIAGHDYDRDPNFDVNRAVDEFARSKNAPVLKMHTEFCIKRTW